MSKKLHENKELVTEMNKQLRNLQNVIENMEEKRGEIFLEWLKTQNKYLVWEQNFNPLRLKKYKRGEVVLAHFGFNVGAEYGGMHYAVVVKKDKKSNSVLNVVPLSSLKEGQTQDDLHQDEVYLGNLQGLNEKEAFAILNQMRPVSKIRVYKPRVSKEATVVLTEDQLDAIDEKIKQMYTK
ncbi:type II toxin-antitoxin system PemK/MazF family toxin (plasmid) [Sutcliffiella horikoshii]|uniref:type II toxin-antitoxin system PemK/MazF family toxin n=1 Tax=Sutcliffiella horikoshii TaxID=79883 RepID=UPI001CBC8460|nr:type II toxin-antitoxin system PemK/MazF family toxin [Sutcliffiella horikoshii]UAL49732.1 type II toxin-antitoxin system PemK/MazF family toxin [Sutcliffiella horikoshii]